MIKDNPQPRSPHDAQFHEKVRHLPTGDIATVIHSETLYYDLSYENGRVDIGIERFDPEYVVIGRDWGGLLDNLPVDWNIDDFNGDLRAMLTAIRSEVSEDAREIQDILHDLSRLENRMSDLEDAEIELQSVIDRYNL